MPFAMANRALGRIPGGVADLGQYFSSVLCSYPVDVGEGGASRRVEQLANSVIEFGDVFEQPPGGAYPPPCYVSPYAAVGRNQAHDPAQSAVPRQATSDLLSVAGPYLGQISMEAVGFPVERRDLFVAV